MKNKKKKNLLNRKYTHFSPKIFNFLFGAILYDRVRNCPRDDRLTELLNLFICGDKKR